MLCQRNIHTTLSQRICHKDPHAADDHVRLNQCATQSPKYHNHHCRTKSPLCAGQTVSVLNNDKSLWLPAKVIHKADHGSYLVQVIGGGQYRCACDYIRECHQDAVKPGTSTIADVAPATPVFAAGTTSKATSSTCCTYCTSNTTTSCFCSNHKHSMQTTTCCAHTTVTVDAFQWRYTKADWCSTLANQLVSVSQPQGLLRRCDPD